MSESNMQKEIQIDSDTDIKLHQQLMHNIDYTLDYEVEHMLVYPLRALLEDFLHILRDLY